MQNVNEVRSLTGLRGIAAIYVVFFHYFVGIGFSTHSKTFLAHGYLAVDLFFVLSGFVMALNYKHMFAAGWSGAAYFKFLGRRFARVYPLYFVCSICALVLGLTIGSEHLLAHPVWLSITFLFNLLMVQIWGIAPSLDAPAWSISAEFAAYLVFPALLIPTLFRRPWLAWLTAFLCLATVAVLCWLPVSWTHNPNPAEGLLDISTPRFALPVARCIAEFALGLLAFRLAGTSFGSKLGSNRGLSSLICLAVLVLMTIPRTDAVIVALLPFLLISVTSGNGIPKRLLSSAAAESAGILSYSLYLTHALMTPAMAWMKRVTQSHGLAHGQMYAATVGIALTVPVAYAAHKLIEVPARQWLRIVFEGDAKTSRHSQLPTP